MRWTAQILPWILAAIVVASSTGTTIGAQNGQNGKNGQNGNGRINFLDLSGSADWEFYKSDGVVNGFASSYDTFRQKYSIDLAGSLVDYRFNRYSVGVDFYKDDRSSDTGDQQTTSIGYRATTMFFPNRPYPLQFFARRATIDPVSSNPADNGRETGAWGAEWNLTLRQKHQARIQYERTSYDLVSPISVQRRQNRSLVEWTQRYERRETRIRYSHSQENELVRDTDSSRQEFTLTDRTRFGNGILLLFNGTRLDSDALFSTGETDALTQNHFSAILNYPRKNRVAWNVSVDHNDTTGKFVDSNHQQIRGTTRILLGMNWEAIAGISSGSLESVTSTATILQDSAGASLGLRYSKQWNKFNFSATGTGGLQTTDFDTGEERSLTNLALELHTRYAMDHYALHGSIAVRQDENDTTGVGFSFDETEVRAGIDGGIGERIKADASAYARQITRDTFQFGIQESMEYGFDTSLRRGTGTLNLHLSSQEGVSDFIPDPSSPGPFLPGADLIQNQELASLGFRMRFHRRFQVRATARFERREYTSIGKEMILSYHPELEYSPGLWRFVLGINHYSRDNGSDYQQDTILFRASRKFF
jgi:hypothetical protein